MRKLKFQGVQVQSLNFPGNPLLEEVYCYETPLTSINLPDNPNLVKLWCWETQLQELDLTQCPGLVELKANDCQLSTLQMHPNLFSASLDNNLFTSIDLANSTHLFSLGLNGNPLQSLSLNGAIDLEYLGIEDCNSLSQINFAGAPSLRSVIAEHTALVDVDLSVNPSLEDLDFNRNPYLQRVNLKNGNNTGIIGFYGQFDNPSLHCIVVDDPAAPNSNIHVQPEVALVGSILQCQLGTEGFAYGEVRLYPNPVANILYLETPVPPKGVKVFNLLGKQLLEQKGPVEQLDLSSLPSGLLFVEIQNEAGTVVKKVVKE
ncbi:MAG: T9SS type A sorting domain-containing protein [Flavobacteriaceae bacterium]